MQPVTLQIRWHELFGETPADIDPEIQREVIKEVKEGSKQENIKETI